MLLLMLSLAGAAEPTLIDLTTPVPLATLAVDGRRLGWSPDGHARQQVTAGRHQVVLLGAMGQELVRTWVVVPEAAPLVCAVHREAPVVRCEGAPQATRADVLGGVVLVVTRRGSAPFLVRVDGVHLLDLSQASTAQLTLPPGTHALAFLRPGDPTPWTRIELGFEAGTRVEVGADQGAWPEVTVVER